MEITYKKLLSGDVSSLKKLLKVFGEAFEEVSIYQENVPSNDYLEGLLEKPNFIVVIAESQNEVVGGLVAYVLEKFEQDRREVYIYDLAVDEKFRRKGVATSLIERLKEISREIDAYVIFVQADPVDAPAVALYEKLGTKEEVFHFDISPN